MPLPSASAQKSVREALMDAFGAAGGPQQRKNAGQAGADPELIDYRNYVKEAQALGDEVMSIEQWRAKRIADHDPGTQIPGTAPAPVQSQPSTIPSSQQ